MMVDPLFSGWMTFPASGRIIYPVICFYISSLAIWHLTDFHPAYSMDMQIE